MIFDTAHQAYTVCILQSRAAVKVAETRVRVTQSGIERGKMPRVEGLGLDGRLRGRRDRRLPESGQMQSLDGRKLLASLKHGFLCCNMMVVVVETAVVVV